MSRKSKRTHVHGELTFRHKTKKKDYVGVARWNKDTQMYVGDVTNVGEDAIAFQSDTFTGLPRALSLAISEYES